MPRLVPPLVAAIACWLLWGCTEAPDVPAAEPVAQARVAAALLTEEHARERSARVGGVAYDLAFELDGEADEFSGRASINFELKDAARDLTVDFVGGTVLQVVLNGKGVDAAYNGYFLTLPAQALAVGPNTVEIAFSHPYSSDGDGLYRFRDPVDGRDYLYTNFEPYDANRLFPCFDQPDLKATYATRVTAPADWQVISITTESSIEDQGERQVWTFPPSARISTYIYALHAGEYQRWESAAGGIPLRLFARASMAERVHPEHWFVPTEQGFAFFENYFDIPYPFGKYDQVIVPHFNAGAMENLGAVTFSERFLHSGKVTRQARRSLASVILHEMAHMWFGDLVTMDWWNGLWLNESFATFMANLALREGTEFNEAPLDAYRRTVYAYRADERDTTHPIEMPTPNTDVAFANFDAITYSKGSATLAQLNHLVGPEPFQLGVSNYLRSHAYGNATIDDFLRAIADAADRNLDQWSADWLHQPGTNGVQVELDCSGGQIASLAVRQTAPAEWPTLRTHRTQLGLYNFERGAVATRLLPVTYSGARTAVAEAAGARCPDFIYANHGDWDYARVDFDTATLAALEAHLYDFEDPLQRAMLWQGIHDMVLFQRLTPRAFIEFVLTHAAKETDDDLLRQIHRALASTWDTLQRLAADQPDAGKVGARIEGTLWRALLDSAPGSDRQLLLLDSYTRSVTSAEGLAKLAGLLDGEGLPGSFDLDQERRWSALVRLAGFEHPDIDALLAAERTSDPSDRGRRSALSVAAARPNPQQQRRLAAMLINPGESALSVADGRAHAAGLFPSHQGNLQLEIVGTVFEALPRISAEVDPPHFRAITRGLIGPICDQGYLRQLEQALNRSESLHPALRKWLLDMRFEVRRCLAIGQAMNAPQPE